jgi:hypothetical protein
MTLTRLCILGDAGRLKRAADDTQSEPKEIKLLSRNSKTLRDGVGQEFFLWRQSWTTGPVSWEICSPGFDGDEDTGDDLCFDPYKRGVAIPNLDGSKAFHSCR